VTPVSTKVGAVMAVPTRIAASLEALALEALAIDALRRYTA
jgi:hypothetical protein